MKRKDKCVLRNYTFVHCEFLHRLKLRFSHNSNTVVCVQRQVSNDNSGHHM